MIQDRNDLIKKNIDDSENAKQEANEQLTQYKKKLEGATKEAHDIIAEAKHNGEAASAELINEGQQKADEMIEKAQSSINIEARKAKHDIQTETAEIALSATRKIIGEDLTTDEHKKLIEKYVKESGSMAQAD